MTESGGNRFVDLFRRIVPDSFVFAIVLTIICAVLAAVTVRATPIRIISGWYEGFWTLLEFGMQMILILVTGYAIALTPQANRLIERIAKVIKSPSKVYVFVTIIGTLFGFVSWGWVVITAVLARKLAEKVSGVNYLYLTAIVYLSSNGWVSGLSSSIPLVLNTDGNFLIETGILSAKIPISMTLGSPLNIAMIAFYLVVPPVLIYALRPGPDDSSEIGSLRDDDGVVREASIEEEAAGQNLPYKALSDSLNNSSVLSLILVLMGAVYIFYYFGTRGFDLNLNIMIFTFLVFGLLLHRTPMRYVIAMKRACSNISGIVFQYPFYAGIMGIMIHTGLGAAIGTAMASNASLYTYPLYSYAAGAIVNFAIPSAGGEYAVLAPSLVSALKEMAAGLSAGEQTAMIAKASLSVAYGETVTNLLQPFFFLTIVPVMCAGVKVAVRDVMGYLFVPFTIYVVVQCILITFVPV